MSLARVGMPHWIIITDSITNNHVPRRSKSILCIHVASCTHNKGKIHYRYKDQILTQLYNYKVYHIRWKLNGEIHVVLEGIFLSKESKFLKIRHDKILQELLPLSLKL